MPGVMQDPSTDNSREPPAELARRPAKPPTANSRTLINFWLDSTLLVLFSSLLWVSLLLRFVFPPGPLAAGWHLWGYTFDQWAGLQFTLLAMLTLGVLVHVMLHWSWVCGVVATRLTKNKKARIDEGLQTIYGVSLLIVLLALLGCGLAVAALMIERAR